MTNSERAYNAVMQIVADARKQPYTNPIAELLKMNEKHPDAVRVVAESHSELVARIMDELEKCGQQH